MGGGRKEDHQLEKLRDEAFDLGHLPGLSFQNCCLPKGCFTHPEKECRIIIIPQPVPSFLLETQEAPE